MDEENKKEVVEQDGDALLKKFISEYAYSLRSDMVALQQANALAASTGMYNPIIAEDYVQSINLTSRVPSQSELTTWLTTPQYFDEELRQVGEFITNNVFQYTRILKHFASLKKFKYDLRPTDWNEEVLDEDAYMKSYQNALKLLRKLNIKYQFEKLDWDIMENGAAFYWLEENDRFMTLLPLPIDYCYITGTWDLGFTGALDLVFFDKMVNYEEFTPEIVNAYKVFVNARKAGLKGEALAPYQYMPLPVDKSWIFIWNPNKALKTPPLAGVFKDSLEIINYKNLLKQKSVLDTFKLIAMKIPYDKDSKKFIVEYKQAAEIVQMTQQLLPPGVRTFATLMEPEDITITQSQTMNNITGLGEQLFYSSIGVAGNLFGSGDVKNGTGLKYSIQSDFDFVSHLYSQYENFINFQLMLKSRKFTWQIKMYGNSLTDSEDMREYANLVKTANFPVGKLFGLAGYEPFEVMPTLNWEAKLGIKEKLMPIVSAFQQSGSEDAGRKEKPTDQLGDAGEVTRDAGSNEE